MICFKNIYLHIPFCKRKCKFCNFFSASIDDNNLKDRYTLSLIDEFCIYKNKNSIKFNKLESLYFGGGTPILLDNDNSLKNLTKIISIFKKEKLLSSQTEITIELNPENLNHIEGLIKLGFNRFSIGIQSFNKLQLEAIDRDFDIEKVLKQISDFQTLQKKINTEREINTKQQINNKQYYKKLKNRKNFTPITLSLDFMFGLPAETLDDIKHNIKIIKKINPEHISYYMFGVHKNYKWLKAQPSDDTIVEMLYLIKNSLETLGYHHYEVSNYAKRIKTKKIYNTNNKIDIFKTNDNTDSIKTLNNRNTLKNIDTLNTTELKNLYFVSKHNFNYWQGSSYLGLGAGAHSFDGTSRWWNNKNLYKYNSGDFVENSELLTLFQHRIERISLGLRTLDIGIKEDLIKKNINRHIDKMLISYENKSAEKFYKINPNFLHLIDWIEEKLI